ncbi:hypothetical protein F5X99DRAFT_371394 [Biscogniauxia marginata]|nr:hypothetical protein F5X99DRAFT_371394 [Biscogniauxia marginata]
MRSSVLLLVLAACGTAFASPVPSDDVAFITTLPSNITTFGSGRKRHGVIPVDKIGCTNYTLDGEETKQAKDNLLVWGKKHKVKESTLHMETVGNSSWWICNCKLSWRDGVPKKELDDVVHILEENCGRNQSGWVWSHKWKKGYNIGSTESLVGKYDKELCPPVCIGLWGTGTRS